MRNRKIQKTNYRPFQLQRFLLVNHSTGKFISDQHRPSLDDDRGSHATSEPATSFSRSPTSVSSISPLPVDVFRYLLQFLNAGDLWKLCQVSREMADGVLECMWAAQRFEFEVVRILHRQNHYTPYEWYRLSFALRHEDTLDRFWVTNASRLIIDRPRQPPPPPGMLPSAVPPSSSDSSLSPVPSNPSPSPGSSSNQPSNNSYSPVLSPSFGSQAISSSPEHMLPTDWNLVYSPDSPGNTMGPPSSAPLAPDYPPGSPNYTTTSPSYSPHSSYSPYSPSSSPHYLFSSSSSPSYSPISTNESSLYSPDASSNASTLSAPAPSPVSTSGPSSSSGSQSDHSTISGPASNSTVHSGEEIRRGIIRNQYWEAQADQILSALIAGTQYATIPSNWCELLAMERAAAAAAGTTELANEDAEIGGGEVVENTADGDAEGAPAASPTDSSTATTSSASTPSVNPEGLPCALLMKLFHRSIQGREPPPLPMQRFWSMIDVLFDPNVVGLNHRRAMVNCARYVASSIESGFGMIVSMHSPSNSYTHSTIMRDWSVSIKPYLRVLLPCQEVFGGVGFEQPSNQQALQAHNRVNPPQRLVSYIQVMLWHRCLSDLVRLHNRIQDQHVRPVTVRSEHTRVHSESSPPLQSSLNSSGSSSSGGSVTQPLDSLSHPICYNALSETLAELKRYHLAPYRIGSRVRRAFHRILRRTRLRVTSMPEKMDKRKGLNEYRRPRDRRSKSRRTSVDLGGAHDAGAGEDPPQKQSIHTNDQGSDGEFMQKLVQWPQREQEIQATDFALRRRKLEDRISQDNLIKKELLSACQMACGLFTLRIPPGSSRPKTVMTLLRLGSPWLKGVWREGEWRRAPVDVDHDEDEVVMSRRLDLEQDYQLEEALLRSSSGATASEIRARLDELYDLSLMEEIYGREGEDDTRDQGPWQRFCLAAIQFLVEESLDWGGNESDDELCKLRVTAQPSGWYYHE